MFKCPQCPALIATPDVTPDVEILSYQCNRCNCVYCVLCALFERAYTTYIVVSLPSAGLLPVRKVASWYNSRAGREGN